MSIDDDATVNNGPPKKTLNLLAQFRLVVQPERVVEVLHGGGGRLAARVVSGHGTEDFAGSGKQFFPARKRSSNADEIKNRTQSLPAYGIYRKRFVGFGFGGPAASTVARSGG